jgi:hypothetical protein
MEAPLRAQHRAKSLARRKKKSATSKPSKWRTKRPAEEIPPLHPHALYRPGRLCALFDCDKSTLWRWAKKGLLPPYTGIAGVKGLTGEQIINFYRQRREAGDE